MSTRTVYKAQVPALTTSQREVLYGMLLGDAHARHGPRYREASVEFRHGLAQRAFVDHLFRVFRAYTWFETPSARQTRSQGTSYTSYGFATFTHPEFTMFHRAFYRPTWGRPPFQKVIPAHVDQWWTPRVLAYHLMSDGAFHPNRVSLYTYVYSHDDCIRYLAVVNARLELHGRVFGHRRGGKTLAYITFPARDLPTLRAQIGPYLLPGFAYKVGQALPQE